VSSNPLFYDNTVITAVNAAAALLNAGFLSIYSGAQPALDGSVTGTLLVQLTFSATAFSSAVAAAGTVTATANAIGSGTAGNTGTAGYFALLASNGTTVIATGVCGTSGSDLNMSTLSISAGTVVSCSLFTLTQPQT
jgi:hypothetical protein